MGFCPALYGMLDADLHQPEVPMGEFLGNWMRLHGGLPSVSFGFPGSPGVWSHPHGMVRTRPCLDFLSLRDLSATNGARFPTMCFILGHQACGGRRVPKARETKASHASLPPRPEEMLTAGSGARWPAGCLAGNRRPGPFEAALRPIW